MSTHTQKHHFLYTVGEWSSNKHQNYLDIIFKDNDIKIIYDIGANVGGTTYIFKEYASQNSKKKKKIYCFEPDKENMSYLQYKLKEDIESNLVECVQKGIYYGKTEARVFGAGHLSENIIHRNVGGYGIEECMKEVVEGRIKNGEAVFCGQVDNKIFQLDTLENLCEDFFLPDFIKIDVEGAEKNILKNSKFIKNAKYMIVEWNQNESFSDFITKYLPEFEIISSECDYLLKRKLIIYT